MQMNNETEGRSRSVGRRVERPCRLLVSPSPSTSVCPPAQELPGLRTVQRLYHVGTVITHPLVSRPPPSREWEAGMTILTF